MIKGTLSQLSVRAWGLLGFLILEILFASMARGEDTLVSVYASGLDSLVTSACNGQSLTSASAYAECAKDQYFSIPRGYWATGAACDFLPGVITEFNFVSGGPFNGNYRYRYNVKLERYIGNFVEDCGNNGTTQADAFDVFVEYSAECETSFDTDSGECYSPPACNQPAGDDYFGFFDGGSGPPSSICLNDCSYTQQGIAVGAGTGWGSNYVSDGSACESGDTNVDSEVDKNCISDGSITYCADTSEPNCGTVNGEYMCLDSIPEGECMFSADGQVVCNEASVSGATQTGTVEYGGNDYNVYGNGIGGSSGTTTGSGSTSGTNAGEGDGVEGEGGECDDSACDGSLPGENESVDGFGDLFASFWGRVEAAPIMSAFSGISGSMVAGTCTGVDSDPIAFLDGATLRLDIHCTLWPELAPILYAVMLAVWALLGGIIILRA